jgi:hypothetical protein
MITSLEQARMTKYQIPIFNARNSAGQVLIIDPLENWSLFDKLLLDHWNFEQCQLPRR